MIRMTKKTRLTSTEVLARASAFFGKEGVGLDPAEGNACCASFEGGGGYVLVTVAAEKGQTLVTVEGREWEHHVKTFLSEV